MSLLSRVSIVMELLNRDWFSQLLMVSTSRTPKLIFWGHETHYEMVLVLRVILETAAGILENEP